MLTSERAAPEKLLPVHLDLCGPLRTGPWHLGHQTPERGGGGGGGGGQGESGKERGSTSL